MKGFVSSRLHPILALLLLVGLIVAGMCLAFFLVFVFSRVAYGMGWESTTQVLQRPQSSAFGWPIMMLMQGLLISAFAVASFMLVYLQGVSWADYFTPRRPVPVGWLLLGAAAIVVSLPAMTGLIAWNTQAPFPAFLHKFEVWARDKEAQAQDLISFLTQFSSTARLVVAVVVIAVVPAIGEELVFRGVVQKQLTRWFDSYHAGVWLAAFLFSAVHLQFLGFVPRLVLGVILGYLFAWSGNILVPIAAHFAQNLVQLLLLYAQQRGALSADLNPDSVEAMPWPWMLLSAVLTVALLRFAYLQFGRRRQPIVSHTLSGEGVAVGGTAAPQGHTLTSHGVQPAAPPPSA